MSNCGTCKKRTDSEYEGYDYCPAINALVTKEQPKCDKYE